MHLLFEEVYESSKNNLELYLAEFTSMVQHAVANQAGKNIVEQLDNVRKVMHQRVNLDSTLTPTDELNILSIINTEHATLTAMFNRLNKD